ncbi:hypothetical protein [Paludibaculum fermentans]|uniref:hypothetical protein n=1 Tax=Paludibaculum fermentans TaxID=1473598 RepID=UPI003EBFC738
MLLRLGVGTALIHLGIRPFFVTLGTPGIAARDAIAGVGGIFLVAGLWTPVVGTVITLDELWIAFSLGPSELDNRLIHIILAVVTAGVAMLGPGAWSIDARIFGRKRFKMENRSRGRNSSL